MRARTSNYTAYAYRLVPSSKQDSRIILRDDATTSTALVPVRTGTNIPGRATVLPYVQAPHACAYLKVQMIRVPDRTIIQTRVKDHITLCPHDSGTTRTSTALV